MADDAQYLERMLAASLDRAAMVQQAHAQIAANQSDAAAALGRKLDSEVARLRAQQAELTEAQLTFDALREAKVAEGRHEAEAIVAEAAAAAGPARLRGAAG